MARPPKWRCIRNIPDVTYFKPAGLPVRLLEEVQLSLEELEAIRLKDLEGLEQEQCATSMKVSRTTFHRVLGSARAKVAEALLKGKAIRIEGGNYSTAAQRYRCTRDNEEWLVPFESLAQNEPQTCPKCRSTEVGPVPPLGFRGGRGRGQGKGRCRRGGPGRRWERKEV